MHITIAYINTEFFICILENFERTKFSKKGDCKIQGSNRLLYY